MSEVTQKVYEITEDLRRDVLSGKVKEIKLKELDRIYENLYNYYQKNFHGLISDIKKKEGIKAQYWGALRPAVPSEFCKKVALYADVLLMDDPLERSLTLRRDYPLKELVQTLREEVEALENLKLLVEKEMLILFPGPYRWKGMHRQLREISEKDTRILNTINWMAKDLDTYGMAISINSALISSKTLGSELVTDFTRPWRGLNFILDKRHPKTQVVVNGQALGSMDLPFLQGVDLETILNVRDEHAEVFEAWREGLGNACSGLEHITDPAEFNEELRHIRAIIDLNLEKLDKWRQRMRPLGSIFRGLGVASVLTGAYFGNLPLGRVAQAFGGLTLKYGEKAAKWLVDNAMRRNFVYFLWRVKEAG